jgi:predicted component of type VI protein secretion system
MSFGSLSIESRGSAMVRELGISLAFLSALTRIEQTKLSLGFRQLKAFSNEDGLKLAITLARLIELRDALSPLTIDLTNPAKTRQAIEIFEGMDSDQIRERVILALFTK